MANTPNEQFLIEFNAVKLLTMAVTKVILDNSADKEKAVNGLVGMISNHVKTQKVEGLDVQETEALRNAITQRVESLVKSVAGDPAFLRK